MFFGTRFVLQTKLVRVQEVQEQSRGSGGDHCPHVGHDALKKAQKGRAGTSCHARASAAATAS